MFSCLHLFKNCPRNKLKTSLRVSFYLQIKKTPHFRYVLGVFCSWCHEQRRAYFLSFPEHHGHHHHHHHHYCLVPLDLEPIWVIWFHTSWLDNDLHARCRVGNRDQSGQEEAFYVLRGRMKSVMHTSQLFTLKSMGWISLKNYGLD